MTQQTNGMPDLKYSEETFREIYEALKQASEAIKIEWLYQTGQFCRPQHNYPPPGSVHGSLTIALSISILALAKAEGDKR